MSSEPNLPDLHALLNRLARSSEATRHLLETRVAPALERIAAALERSGGPPAPDLRSLALSELQARLDADAWEEAQALLDDFARDFPGDHAIEGLLESIDGLRKRRAESLLAQLQASREVNDSRNVLDVRDALARHLEADQLQALDVELVPWLLLQIQNRMRHGTVGADVVELAGLIVERFGETRQGASLRASLPVLRRSVGLCPRCAAAYTGFESACPRCLANPEPPGPGR